MICRIKIPLLVSRMGNVSKEESIPASLAHSVEWIRTRNKAPIDTMRMCIMLKLGREVVLKNLFRANIKVMFFN